MEIAKLQKARTSSRPAHRSLLESGADILDTSAEPETVGNRQLASVDNQLYAAGKTLLHWVIQPRRFHFHIRKCMLPQWQHCHHVVLLHEFVQKSISRNATV